MAVAGGVAATRGNQSKRSKVLKSLKPGSGLKKAVKGMGLPKPDMGKGLQKLGKALPDADASSMIDWVEEKAKDVGDAGYRVAELSSQAKTVHKAVSGG
jgi:hypothetical protein